MMITLKNVSKSYAGEMGLNAVNLQLGQGRIALMGANGSGKSTLLQLLATLLTPDSGMITWQGLNYAVHRDLLRPHIGYVPQFIDLPKSMRVKSLFAYLAQLRQVSEPDSIGILSQALGINHLLNARIGELSGGEQRLVALLQALMSQPRLLLIDEIYKSLSFEERKRVSRTIKQFAHDALVIVSTHLPDAIQDFATEIVLLRNQRVLIHQSSAAFEAQAVGQVHRVIVPFAELEAFQEMYQVSQLTRTDDGMVCRVIGAYPTTFNSVSLEPTLTDAYLWYQQQAS